MKSLYLRTIVALACVAGLAACGGKGNGNVVLGGSVVGLKKDGLVLMNGSATAPVPKGASGFTFTQLIGSDTQYDVRVKTDPQAAHCTVQGGSGKSSNYNVNNIVVTCVTEHHPLGGEVSGLDATESLTILKAPETLAITKNGPFTLKDVDDGDAYAVSLLPASIPAAKKCEVTNGGGVMGKDPINNVKVVCVPKPV
ncbi:hypothetical protein [Janthinobacterium fluminis]|uniref:Lipoprotein n=1 Tax=Janthinobacterium fluminis TaxID=2987524 RepID=A0ABT5K4V5_9BURK|nr:hypothetical protein [Janthinobacterium fluminis]MDC8759490.1 hypothetical protein [Janthinobacterium fluminis]